MQSGQPSKPAVQLNASVLLKKLRGRSRGGRCWQRSRPRTDSGTGTDGSTVAGSDREN